MTAIISVSSTHTSLILHLPLKYIYIYILNLFVTVNENVWWVILILTCVQHKAGKYTELSLALCSLQFLMTTQQLILCLVRDMNSKVELMILSVNNTEHEIYSRKGEAAVLQWPIQFSSSLNVITSLCEPWRKDRWLLTNPGTIALSHRFPSDKVHFIIMWGEKNNKAKRVAHGQPRLDRKKKIKVCKCRFACIGWKHYPSTWKENPVP